VSWCHAPRGSGWLPAERLSLARPATAPPTPPRRAAATRLSSSGACGSSRCGALQLRCHCVDRPAPGGFADDLLALPRRCRDLQALLERAVGVPPEQLPAFVEAEREALTTAFLAYVAGSSPAGRASLGGASGLPSSAPPAATGPGRDSASLAELAARLTMLKERADWEASKRLLPSAAASLAAANLAAWRASQKGKGQAEALPEVAPGVSLEDVYRAGEREVGDSRMHASPKLFGVGRARRVAGFERTSVVPARHTMSADTAHTKRGSRASAIPTLSPPPLQYNRRASNPKP
jgi:hypothetical protein